VIIEDLVAETGDNNEVSGKRGVCHRDSSLICTPLQMLMEDMPSKRY